MHEKILWNWRLSEAEVRPGNSRTGLWNVSAKLESLPQDTPLLIEHLETAEEYDLSREYIFSVGKETGVDL